MTYERDAALSERAALEQQVSHLERIIKISQTLNTTLTLEPLLEKIIEVATELTETEGCAILLLDGETNQLRFEVANGPNREALLGLLVPLENSIAGSILLKNQPLLIQTPQEDPRFFREADEQTAYQTQSIIGVPLRVRGQTIGVLEAVNKLGGQEMGWADVEVLNILADQAAVAIENARLYEDIRRMKDFHEELVQRLAEGIVVIDERGFVTFVNPAAATLLGYPAGELVGQHWRAVITSDQQAYIAAAIERRQRGETDRYKIELERRDGGRTPVLVSGSPRFDRDTGDYAGSVAVFTDISQTLEHQRIEQELALAWQIQSSLLPTHLPPIPGWQLAATLRPARQTSGDFYDLIPLLNERLGILIADVAGKGTGAALYMAVSHTLLRTYASEFHERPELALRAANRRILVDTQADLFVTVFYGVLDPATGAFTYCNAGHNPPYLLSPQAGGAVQELTRTGMPLGTFEGLTWEQRTVQLLPGDTLLLYTDGITDAEDEQRTFYGRQRLLALMRANLGRSAEAIKDTLMSDVDGFIGGEPHAPLDDIALVVLVRGEP
jgi:PAS domain S-box-containing protein